nr:hypothetical protein [uncultured Flavobacterium sp.]
MDISFPEWKTNRGLGFTSLKFVIHCIEFLTLLNLEKNDEVLNLKSLRTLYLSLAEDYERFRIEYQSIFLAYALQKFAYEFEDVIEDEYLTDFRYNCLYETFVKVELEKVIYEFK